MDNLKRAASGSDVSRDYFIDFVKHPDTGVTVTHDGAPYLRPDPSQVDITRPRLVETPTATVAHFEVDVVLEDRSDVLRGGRDDD